MRLCAHIRFTGKGEPCCNEMKRNRFITICLIAYLFVILYLTLCRTPADKSSARLTLFWSYRVFRAQWKQIFGNVLVFVPLGFLLRATGKKPLKAVLLGFLLSVAVELTQFYGHLGLCELDDVFHNTLGTAIGCGSFSLFEHFTRFKE